MGAMSPTHWLIVIAVFVLLFGAKKLPELARSLGQSTRVLKSEMRVLREDETDRSGEHLELRAVTGSGMSLPGSNETRTSPRS
ncbi:Sec-independent protein translocase subunit TatA [Pseudonocardia nematodicida]|uniref:Sec-independent protein translocase protein TatA n=1 Tax=Pseudonocardia nematodicida TaxID=1206997 RepID=A0ABV1KBU9_9PSEU